MNKWKIIHIHSTPLFYVETQSGRKPHNAFSYMSWIITFIRSTNFIFFPSAIGRRLQPPNFSGYNLREAPTSNSLATTIRRLQPPSFLGYNLREAPTPQLSGYNLLCSSATTKRWLQPPVLASSCHPEVEVEWWNHYHTITVNHCHIIAVNLYQ